MSALGQKQTSAHVRVMSPLPRKQTFADTIGMSALCQIRGRDQGTSPRRIVAVENLTGFARRRRGPLLSFGCRCPLWVKNRHGNQLAQCPLYPQKRTLVERVRMSALCQKRTHALQQFCRYSITSSARAINVAGNHLPPFCDMR